MAEEIPRQSNRIALEKDSVAWSPCMLGDNFNHGSNCSIGSLAHIGRNVTMGDNCRIQGSVYVADGCTLGNDVFLGPNATLLNDKYPPSGDSKYWKPVTVESGAVIGGGSTILPGCNVGQLSVLGAGSVLTKNLPQNEVWAGNPATFIMNRHEYESKREQSQ
mgnify:FL=1